MTKSTLGAHPFLLGFGELERLVERTAKSGQDGYPPYNIEQTSDRSWRITLAVAGFGEADLAITVEDRQLVVRGRHGADDGHRTFLHRGIAARQFQRTFVLADGVDVGEAVMENGLLHVDLSRPVPEAVVQTVRIRKGGADRAISGPSVRTAARDAAGNAAEAAPQASTDNERSGSK